ncbi:MAG: twin-arginine translocation signal domain-containing protein, partial [bacterium]
MSVNRRTFIKAGAAGVGLALSGCAAIPDRPLARVVVIGGGYGGATAAKYINHWSRGAIEVYLIERERNFVSCPISTLVLGGSQKMETITHSYMGLRER